MHAGDRGDTHIDGPPLVLQRDATILRQAPLGNIERSHDFKT